MDKHTVTVTNCAWVSMLQFPQADRGGSNGIDLLIKTVASPQVPYLFLIFLGLLCCHISNTPRQFTFSAWWQPVAALLCGELVVDAEHSAG